MLMKNLEAMERSLLEFGKNIKILYVEDEASIREEVIEFLSNYFDNVVSAVDGLDGLNKYKNSEFDLIISDIRMPKMDGIEMCKEIKNLNNEQNILIMSAHSDSHYLLTLIDIGVDNYIIKPIDDNKLIQTLYKISKRVIDSKYSLEYQEKLLDVNFKLDNLNQELKGKNESLEGLVKKLKNSENQTIATIKTIEDNPTQPEKVQIFHKKFKPMSRDEFLEKHPFALDKLAEQLEQISEDFDLIINKIHRNIDIESFQSIAFYLKEYGKLLRSLPEFSNISYALETLADTIETTETLERYELIKEFLLALAKNLYLWENSIFRNDSTQDIHYLDDSLITDCASIENILKGNEEDDDDDDDLMMF